MTHRACRSRARAGHQTATGPVTPTRLRDRWGRERQSRLRSEKPWSCVEGRGFDSRHLHPVPPRRARSDDRTPRGRATGSPDRDPGRTSGWRWRESNPRPSTHGQGFSERSPLRLCSTPPITRTSRCDGPSRCEMSRACPRPARTVSHLADARNRADDEPGLTATPTLLSGSEGVRALIGIGACVVCNGWLTSSSLPSSARFPWSPDRSRDHSPPV